MISVLIGITSLRVRKKRPLWRSRRTPCRVFPCCHHPVTNRIPAGLTSWKIGQSIVKWNRCLNGNWLSTYSEMTGFFFFRLNSKFDLRRLCRSVGATILPKFVSVTWHLALTGFCVLIMGQRISLKSEELHSWLRSPAAVGWFEVFVSLQFNICAPEVNRLSLYPFQMVLSVSKVLFPLWLGFSFVFQVSQAKHQYTNNPKIPIRRK